MIAVLLACYSVPEADRAAVLADVDAANAMFDQANAAFEREVRRLDELRASATLCPLKAVVDAHTSPQPRRAQPSSIASSRSPGDAPEQPPRGMDGDSPHGPFKNRPGGYRPRKRGRVRVVGVTSAASPLSCP